MVPAYKKEMPPGAPLVARRPGNLSGELALVPSGLPSCSIVLMANTRDFSLLLDRCLALSVTPTPVCLTVSIERQTLDLYRDGALRRSFVVSTSRNPPSCVQDSEGTPTGLHEIADLIGDGEPRGMVFRGRIPTGRRHWEEPPHEQERNLITTRILRLRGLEEGVNRGPGVDSFERYIYLHGTNHEDRLGRPASGGCVLLSNRDIEELYDSVDPGTLVLIAGESHPWQQGS